MLKPMLYKEKKGRTETQQKVPWGVGVFPKKGNRKKAAYRKK